MADWTWSLSGIIDALAEVSLLALEALEHRRFIAKVSLAAIFGLSEARSWATVSNRTFPLPFIGTEISLGTILRNTASFRAKSVCRTRHRLAHAVRWAECPCRAICTIVPELTCFTTFEKCSTYFRTIRHDFMTYLICKV